MRQLGTAKINFNDQQRLSASDQVIRSFTTLIAAIRMNTLVFPCIVGPVAEWLACYGLRRRRAWVQIAAATLSGLRQTVHTHRASVHQTAKLVAALLRVARVTEGLAESNGSLPPGL